jgi:hypothetical protein
MTVARMRAELDQDEFVRWSKFYGLMAQQRQLEHLKAGG